jgi:hypothetical protein
LCKLEYSTTDSNFNKEKQLGINYKTDYKNIFELGFIAMLFYFNNTTPPDEFTKDFKIAFEKFLLKSVRNQ